LFDLDQQALSRAVLLFVILRVLKLVGLMSDKRTMPRSTFILSAAIILSSAFTAAADSLPRIDIQKNCNSRAQAVVGLSNSAGNALEACIRAEQRARDALAAAWKDIPPFYKANCIKPGDYSPSYEEWIACLEMNIDVKNLRAKR
jgi:hypothetical protein